MGVSAHRDEHLELCAALALGAIDERDRRELEAHLAAGCPECSRELSRLSDDVRTLAASAPPVAPPPAVRARVLAAVRSRAPAERPARGRVVALEPRRRIAIATWAWAAAAAVLAVSTVVLWRVGEDLRARLDESRGQMAKLQTDLDEARRWAALLDSPEARLVELLPTPAAGLPRARALYDPAARRAVLVFDSFAAPPGSDYELWAIRGDGPASLGLIRADASGRAVVRVHDVGDPASLQAFAVSLERAGGSTNPRQPQGPVVMVGGVGG